MDVSALAELEHRHLCLSLGPERYPVDEIADVGSVLVIPVGEAIGSERQPRFTGGMSRVAVDANRVRPGHG